MALDHRLKSSNLRRSRRMLQVIHSAAVCDRRHQGSQLQRRHRNALAERAHLPYSAELRGNFFFRINPRLLAFNVISGQLTQAV